MKKVFSLMVLLASIVLVLPSCGSDSSSKRNSDEPTVTYDEGPYTLPQDGYNNNGEVVFRGGQVHTLHDANRTCPNNSNSHFVITKSITNSIINSADKCDKCAHCWYVHDKK